jgi:hypothetical protein
MMLFSASFAFAQTTISGTVKDGESGETLPGVSISGKRQGNWYHNQYLQESLP